MEVALAVLEGKADAGFGIATVARQLRLEFIPLHKERYDLVVGRRDYFEPSWQRLLAFGGIRPGGLFRPTGWSLL